MIGAAPLRPAGDRRFAYIAYAICLTLLFVGALWHLSDPHAAVSLTLAFTLALVVPVSALLPGELDLAEPIHWFAAMYYLFAVGAIYFIFTDFEYSAHTLVATQAARYTLLGRTLALLLLGWCSLMLGYRLGRGGRPMRVRIEIEPGWELPSWMLRLVVAVLALVGLLNFIYLVRIYPGGILEYFGDIGIRKNRLELIGASVTTVGFQFLYAAVILWLFVVVRRWRMGQSRREAVLFAIVAVVSIVIMIGQGRMFQTVSYMLTLVSLIYVCSSHPRRNRVFIAGSAALLAGGVALYFLRLLSLVAYNNPELLQRFSAAQLFLVAVRGASRLLIDKGNIPDVAALMNIVAFWERDFGLQLGASLGNWVTAFVPDTEGASIAVQSADRWYGSVGGVPPTIVGEWYANFAAPGVLAGMFALGAAMGKLYAATVRRSSYWWAVALLAVTFRFFFILPKGETVTFVGAVWLAAPPLLVVLVLRIVARVARAR
jgi:hypothetical protein